MPALATGAVEGVPRRFLTRPDVQVGILLVIALAARLSAVLSLADLPWFERPNADSAMYHEMADAFATGDLLIGVEPLRMSPAYPFFLGAVYRLFGDGPFGIRFVQIFLGLGLVALTWDTARRLYGPSAALVAGGLVALFGPELFYEAQLLGDAPAAALVALSLWAIVRATIDGNAGRWRWLTAGLASGAVVLFRPNALVLLVPLTVAAVSAGRSRRERQRYVLAAALGFFVGLSPVPLRNLIVTGHPSLSAENGGLDLYMGNGPEANGGLKIPAEFSNATGPGEVFAASHAAAEQAVGRVLDSSDVERYWMHRTLSFIAAEPQRWLTLMLWKLRLFWNGSSTSDIEHYEFTRTLSGVFALPFVQWWALMPLALIGTVVALRNRGPAALVALFNIVWCAGVIIIFVVDRYRLPAISGLAIAAVAGIWTTTALWKSGSRRARAALLALTAAALATAWPVGVVTDFGALWSRLGATYELTGRLDDARAAYRRAEDLSPGDRRARAGLERLNRMR